MSELIEGLVIKAQSGFFTVHTEEGDYVCRLRGRLKEEWKKTDLVAVADLLGHENVETTARYARSTMADRRAAVEGLV
jgi:hypothetical protein